MAKGTFTVRKVEQGEPLHRPCEACGAGPDVAPVAVCKCRATTYYLPGDELSRLAGDAQRDARWAASFAAKYAPRAAEFPLVAKFPQEWSELAVAISRAQICAHVKPFDPENPTPHQRRYFMPEDEAARMAEGLLSAILALDVTTPVV